MLELLISLSCLVGLLGVPVLVRSARRYFGLAGSNAKVSEGEALQLGEGVVEKGGLGRAPDMDFSPVTNEWLIHKGSFHFYPKTALGSDFGVLEMVQSLHAAAEPEVQETENDAAPKIVSIAEYQKEKRRA